MCRSFRWFCLVLATCLLPAKATDYTYSASLLLTSATYSTSGLSETVTFALPAPSLDFQLKTGDTISGTISFNGTINLSTAIPLQQWLQLSFGPTPSAASNNSASEAVTLLGTSGAANSNTVTGTMSGGGLVLMDLNLLSTGSQLGGTLAGSFSGFSYSATISSENDPGLTYAPGALTFSTWTDDFSTTTAPEPGTGTLLFCGLGVIGLFYGVRRWRAGSGA